MKHLDDKTPDWYDEEQLNEDRFVFKMESNSRKSAELSTQSTLLLSDPSILSTVVFE